MGYLAVIGADYPNQTWKEALFLKAKQGQANQHLYLNTIIGS